MFDTQEFDDKIIKYLARRRYATPLQLAKFCNCHYNDIMTAFARIKEAGEHDPQPVAPIWSKKLNCKVWFYCIYHGGIAKKGASIKRAHRNTQLKWLKDELLIRTDPKSVKEACKYLFATSKIGIAPAPKPQYFLLSIDDVLECYKFVVDALSES